MSKILQALMGIPMLILVSVANAEEPRIMTDEEMASVVAGAEARIMTDEEMASVVAGAPIDYPNAGLRYDSVTGVLTDLTLGFTYKTRIDQATFEYLLKAASGPTPF